MEKNRLYVIIFGLLFVVVILLGLMNILSNSLNRNKNESAVVPSSLIPTSNFIPPTSLPTQFIGKSEFNPNPAVSPIFSFNYPIKYEGHIIDYLPERRRMIVYYPGTRILATEMVKKFFTQYGASDSAQLQIEVGYVGVRP